MGKDVEKLEPLLMAGGNIKSCSCFESQFGRSSGSSIEFQYDSPVPFLSMYPGELQAFICVKLLHKFHNSEKVHISEKVKITQMSLLAE